MPLTTHNGPQNITETETFEGDLGTDVCKQDFSYILSLYAAFWLTLLVEKFALLKKGIQFYFTFEPFWSRIIYCILYNLCFSCILEVDQYQT